uniref:IS66 family transposase n=1 Tax=Pseudomonas yamanorum TaxID=515393 RepID=UPI001E384632
MTTDYAGYNALGAQSGVELLGYWTHVRRKFAIVQKMQPKGKMGREIALKHQQVYSTERDPKRCGDAETKSVHHGSLPVLALLKSRIEKMQPQDTA